MTNPDKTLPGHLTVTFKGREETLAGICGSAPITFAEMQQRLWSFLVGNNLVTYLPAPDN